MNFSIGIQNLWFTSRRTLRRDGVPVEYMDVNGDIHPYTAEYGRSLSQTADKDLYRRFVCTVYSSIVDHSEFQSHKNFWHNCIGLALYVNRLIAIEPDYERYGITMRRYSIPYFGMELNLKI